MIKQRWTWGAGLGLAVGLLGVLVGLLPAGLALEEQFGLDGLFRMRGPRPAPSEVVVITIDKVSAEYFQLPNEPRKWPRHLHAQLVDNLARAGAAVIGFDIHFAEPRDPVQDRRFAQAVQRAGNVVLFEHLQKEVRDVTRPAGDVTGEIVTERRIPPIPMLAQAAVATAPFPLPKVPVKVSQFWLFKGGAGDVATLPTVMFQLYAQAVYPELLRLLREITPDAQGLPADVDALRRERDLPRVMEQLRWLFQQPVIREQFGVRLTADRALAPETRRMLTALAHLYQDRPSRYLNYYGPPRSLTTLPYHQVWQANGGRDQLSPDLRGKLVLVGFSERLQPEQKDGFYTVYSQEKSGLDISGVEIAATALANMIADNPVRPLDSSWLIALLFSWGLLAGLVASSRHFRWGLSALVVAGLVWLVAAVQLFTAHALWLPIIVPLVVQAPLAGVAALLWRYREVGRERNRIRQAFRHYLPERAVTALARDLHAAPGGELLYGVCLATDAAHYSGLAERMPPTELAALLNRYYESLFAPVRHHGGFVSDVVGDAMLAVWAQATPEASQRAQACQAALEIALAAEHFRATPGSGGLRTRIGLHAGQILLGNVGTVDHFEYRAVGDIVNTASRLQDLNKTLGTRVLVSRETVDGLDQFLLRDVGVFRLSGKSIPTPVLELRGLAVTETDAGRALLEIFSASLRDFSAGRFEAARTGFVQCLERDPEDGPTRFYHSLCERFLANPPAPEWDGILSVSELQSSPAVAPGNRH